MNVVSYRTAQPLAFAHLFVLKGYGSTSSVHVVWYWETNSSLLFMRTVYLCVFVWTVHLPPLAISLHRKYIFWINLRNVMHQGEFCILDFVKARCLMRLEQPGELWPADESTAFKWQSAQHHMSLGHHAGNLFGPSRLVVFHLCYWSCSFVLFVFLFFCFWGGYLNIKQHGAHIWKAQRPRERIHL